MTVEEALPVPRAILVATAKKMYESIQSERAVLHVQRITNDHSWDDIYQANQTYSARESELLKGLDNLIQEYPEVND